MGMFNASKFYEEVAWSVKEALSRLERLHFKADLLVCGLDKLRRPLRLLRLWALGAVLFVGRPHGLHSHGLHLVLPAPVGGACLGRCARHALGTGSATLSAVKSE